MGLLEKKKKKKASGQLKEWKKNWGSHWLDTSVSCFSLRSDHQRNWSHLYNFYMFALQKYWNGKKEANGLFLGAPRLVCQAKGFVCASIDTWSSILFFFFHLPTAAPTDEERKKDCVSVTQMSPSCQISFPYPQNVETEAKEDTINE